MTNEASQIAALLATHLTHLNKRPLRALHSYRHLIPRAPVGKAPEGDELHYGAQVSVNTFCLKCVFVSVTFVLHAIY